MNKLINKLNSQKGQSGFTIIEVLIVLAIGALIILAVLLAVPALQRNQEANKRKAEASRVATAAVAKYSDGNSTMPATSASDADLKNSAGLDAATASQGTVKVQPAGADAVTSLGIPANNIVVVTDGECVGVGGKKTTGKIAVYWSSTKDGTTATGCIQAQ